MDTFKVSDEVVSTSGFSSGKIEAIVDGHLDIRTRAGALIRNCLPDFWRHLGDPSVSVKVQAVPLARGELCNAAITDEDNETSIFNGEVLLTRDHELHVKFDGAGFSAWVPRKHVKRGHSSEGL